MNNKRQTSIAIVLAIVGLTASVAVAQSSYKSMSPAPASPVASPVASPFWVGKEGVPTSILLEEPTAAARETAIEWRYRFGVVEYKEELARKVLTHGSSPAYTRANASLREAQLEHNRARDRVLDRLIQQPTYLGNRVLHERLGRQIEDERGAQKPDAPKIRSLSEMRLQTVRANRAAESQALANDPAFELARQRLVTAGSAVKLMNDAFARDVRTDDALIQLRRDYRLLKIDHLAAAAYRDGVRGIASDAAEFSLRLRTYDRNQPQYKDNQRRYDDPYYVNESGSIWDWSR